MSACFLYKQAHVSAAAACTMGHVKQVFTRAAYLTSSIMRNSPVISMIDVKIHKCTTATISSLLPLHELLAGAPIVMADNRRSVWCNLPGVTEGTVEKQTVTDLNNCSQRIRNTTKHCLAVKIGNKGSMTCLSCARHQVLRLTNGTCQAWCMAELLVVLIAFPFA